MTDMPQPPPPYVRPVGVTPHTAARNEVEAELAKTLQDPAARRRLRRAVETSKIDPASLATIRKKLGKKLADDEKETKK